MDDSSALDYALSLIQQGILSIDGQGRIWRHAILSHGIWRTIPARRAESVGGKGYLRLMLQINGRLRGVGAHRVVWSNLNGPIPSQMQINHIDCDKRNNAPTNLEVVTQSENMRHSYANDRPRVRPWSLSTAWRGRPMLTKQQHAEARSKRASGMILKDIAAHYGISLTHAQRITS